jgi:ankyrin repeat protein
MMYSFMGGDWKELMHAAEAGDAALVAYHLTQGVDPNYQHPEYLTTPLIEAARQGHLEVVRELLSHGADAALPAVWGKETALSVANAAKHQPVVAFLTEWTERR